MLLIKSLLSISPFIPRSLSVNKQTMTLPIFWLRVIFTPIVSKLSDIWSLDILSYYTSHVTFQCFYPGTSLSLLTLTISYWRSGPWTTSPGFSELWFLVESGKLGVLTAIRGREGRNEVSEFTLLVLPSRLLQDGYIL